MTAAVFGERRARLRRMVAAWRGDTKARSRARRAARILLLSFLAPALLAADLPKFTARGDATVLPVLNLRDPRQALTQYKIDVWQTDQGLPLNTVQALLEAHDGYLWVGTGGGLARFDGVSFKTFDAHDVPELAAKPIFGFMEDSSGNLWIGHTDGATIYRDGHFRAAFGREVTAGRRVWSFAQDHQGVIWIASENGLIRWNNGVTRVYQQADGLPVTRIRSLAFDRDGTLWLATTGGGLVSFSHGRFAALTPANGFPHLEVRYVLADPAGGVWAATAGGGLAHVDHGRIETFTTRNGLPTDQLTALARGDEGSLWIGTWGGGLCRMRDGRFSSISTESGLAGGQIWSLHADREGSVWVGTWTGGLNRLRPRAFVVLGTPEGLSGDNVRAVLHASDGVTWIATAGGGVDRIEQGRIRVIGRADGLPSDEISSLCEDRNGAIWVGTYTGGVARITGDHIETFGTANGLPNVDIRVLHQDRSGTLWAGTLSGLARFTGNGFVAVRDPGAPKEGVTTILQDRAGTMWFGTTGQGLVRYRNGVFETLTRKDGLVSNWVMSLLEDEAGDLWIGTNGEGLNRLRNGRLSAIRTADGLWDGVVETILEDHLGYFWMTCNRGFFRASRAELDAFADGRISAIRSIGYGPGDALRSTTFAGGNQPAGAVDPGGHLWLPTFSGLVIVDPAGLPLSGTAPPVRIEEASVNGVELPPGKAVVLPPGGAPLSIRFTAMSLLNAGRVRFRYRLDGTAGEWVDAGHSREAVIPTLAHGSYLFRVAASLDGVNWREAPNPLPITVRSYFFQRSWFILLAVAALIIAVAAAMRMRTRQLRRRHDEMERLIAEKTEELRLANEHLAHLSLIDALTGLANRRRFDDALEQEWRRASRYGTPVALVIADVDHFKAYNDTAGHLEGDRCLVSVADVLRQSVQRAGDLVARYGGEEFVVLLPGMNQSAASTLAERLRKACESRAIPHPASPVSPSVTISLGVASRIPSDDSSSDALVAEADAALYQAKRDGRNRICCAQAADPASTRTT